MASVYKIEIEVVSDWVNYTEKEIKEKVMNALFLQEINFSEINVNQTS